LASCCAFYLVARRNKFGVGVNGIVFAVIVLAASVVLVAVLAWVSRRLLGLPVGTLRAVIAGLVGFAAALILGQALRATESGHLAVFFSVAVGVPLIVAMIFIVAAEALLVVVHRLCPEAAQTHRGVSHRPWCPRSA
jgi:phosphate/sulfate permease